MMVMNSATFSLLQSWHYTLSICVFYQRGNIIHSDYKIHFECCHLVGVNGFISMSSTAMCLDKSRVKTPFTKPGKKFKQN